ncbi:MAG: hypothetical protein ACRCST_12770 [Turicibacter sp.]
MGIIEYLLYFLLIFIVLGGVAWGFTKQRNIIMSYGVKWLGIALATGILLYVGTSFLTQTQIKYFDWLEGLLLLGFSITIATLTTCTQIIIKKIESK